MQAILIGEDRMKMINAKLQTLKMENGKFFKSISGFSLIEMLVVLFVFSILAIVVTQTLSLSLRGSQKSESLGNTRENVAYAINVMDRLLRNSRSLTCSTSTGARLNYIDEHGNAAYFACVTSGTDTYIASNSSTQRLTVNNMRITNCNAVFTCTQGLDVPDEADISIAATDANNPGAEGSGITVSTKILLRNY